MKYKLNFPLKRLSDRDLTVKVLKAIALMACLFFYTIHFDIVLDLFDDKILLYLDVSKLVFVVSCSTLGVITLLISNYIWHNNYLLSTKHVLVLFILGAHLLGGHISGRYHEFTVALGLPISLYLFVLISVILSFQFVACCKLRCKRETLKSVQQLPIVDCPVKEHKKDYFGWQGDVERMIDIIDRLDLSSGASNIAVTGEWGSGKTSFLNFVISRLDDKKYFSKIVFNPRHSRAVGDIQRDFFDVLKNHLSKYDSSFSKLIPQYSRLLLESGAAPSFWKKLLSSLIFSNSIELKKQISQRLKLRNQRLLIVVDDFDRLTKPEILEVLKITDGIANFNETLFLTAFDKTQVNRIFCNSDNLVANDNYYIDKYFSYEFPVPKVRFTTLANYSQHIVRNQDKISDSDFKRYMQWLNQYHSIIDKYIHNIRDMKRFLNMAILGYIEVQEYVVLEEFLLIKLIRFRYEDIYRKIYKGEYVQLAKLADSSERFCSLISKKETLPDYVEPIIGHLFPTHNDEIYKDIEDRFSVTKRAYTGIKIPRRFDMYFQDNIQGEVNLNPVIDYLYNEAVDFKKDIPEEIKKLYKTEETRFKMFALLVRYCTPIHGGKTSCETIQKFYFNLVVLLLKLLHIKYEPDFENLVQKCLSVELIDVTKMNKRLVDGRNHFYKMLLHLDAQFTKEVLDIATAMEQLSSDLIDIEQVKTLAVRRLSIELSRLVSRPEAILLYDILTSKFRNQLLLNVFSCYEACIDEKTDDTTVHIGEASKLLRTAMKNKPQMFFDAFNTVDKHNDIKKNDIKFIINTSFINSFGSHEQLEKYLLSSEFESYSRYKEIRIIWSRFKENNFDSMAFQDFPELEVGLRHWFNTYTRDLTVETELN